MYEQTLEVLKARKAVCLELVDNVTVSEAEELANVLEAQLGHPLERRHLRSAAKRQLVIWMQGLCRDPFKHTLLGDEVHAKREYPAA